MDQLTKSLHSLAGQFSFRRLTNSPTLHLNTGLIYRVIRSVRQENDFASKVPEWELNLSCRAWVDPFPSALSNRPTLLPLLIKSQWSIKLNWQLVVWVIIGMTVIAFPRKNQNNNKKCWWQRRQKNGQEEKNFYKLPRYSPIIYLPLPKINLSRLFFISLAKTLPRSN